MKSVAFLVGLIFWLTPSVSFALPRNFKETTYVRGLNAPTAMAFAPDGRLFVAEQGGKLRVVKKGKLLRQPFLTVRTQATGERGLLGVALDPEFSSNRYVYLYYTVSGSPPHNRVSRFRASATDPDRAAAGSERVIIELESLSSATNHNGGALHFGNDGKLYIGVGENANGSNSQSLKNRLGKLLRVNSDGSIPTDNPFSTRATGVNRAIWALGLRNPFTFAVDPKTGRIFINDVGQNTWEEINRGRAGANFGWPRCEGRCSVNGLVNPLYQYSTGEHGAITGGAFYRGNQFPSAYDGSYFFADYLQNFIRRRDAKGRVTTFHGRAKSPVDLDVGPDGALYYLSIFEGRVLRISYSPN